MDFIDFTDLMDFTDLFPPFIKVMYGAVAVTDGIIGGGFDGTV